MRSGISTRHGPHQVAQKLTSTTLPRHSAEEIVLPLMSVTLNSGTSIGSFSSRTVTFSPRLSFGSATSAAAAGSEREGESSRHRDDNERFGHLLCHLVRRFALAVC